MRDILEHFENDDVLLDTLSQNVTDLRSHIDKSEGSVYVPNRDNWQRPDAAFLELIGNSKQLINELLNQEEQ